MKTLSLHVAVIVVFSSVIISSETACSGGLGTGVSGVSFPQLRNRDTWMSPKASTTKQLLYISDAKTAQVDVYTYPSGSLIGSLSGFVLPTYLCVDSIGDVWVTDFRASEVYEYAHGGSQPIAEISTQGRPDGCSVDRKTGNLAVTNASLTTGSGSGFIEIYQNGTRLGSYENSSCNYFNIPGYDNRGDLYVECGSGVGQFVTELAKGSSSLVMVPFDQTISATGGVMWDGEYLTITDTNYQDTATTAIYQTVRAGSGALTTVGTTILGASCNGGDHALVFQPFIVGKKNTPVNKTQGTVVIGPDGTCLGFNFWAYPGGGYPTSSLASPPAIPVGEAVSIAPQP